MAKKKPTRKKKKGPGRPTVKIKKEVFQVMLDPRYIKHFRKIAKEKKVRPQDLARFALNALIPDPFGPSKIDVIPTHESKGEKRKAY